MAIGGALIIAVPLIRQFEGCRLAPYLDTGGVPTIGWGDTTLLSGERVTMQTPAIAQSEADALNYARIVAVMNSVNIWTGGKANDNQLAALTSLGYNIGEPALHASTLLRDFNAGDITGASGQFPEWDLVRGVRSNGLWNRRIKEQQIFNTPVAA